MKTTGVFGSVGGTLFGPLQGGKLGAEVEEEALPSKPVFFDAIEFLQKSQIPTVAHSVQDIYINYH